MTVPSPPPPATAAAPAPAAPPQKLGGYDFYRSLGSPKYVVAPMVDQSELAWRLLSKAPLSPEQAGPSTIVTGVAPDGTPSQSFVRHQGGAHLSYTPMIHAKVFTQSKNGKESLFNLRQKEEGSAEPLAGIEGGDRPLFVQFCANDPEVLLEAARIVEDRCDAVDINFGCPQGIARRGHYGSFLQDEWELITALISTLDKNLKVPVTAKFRVFPDVEKTVRYAKMIEAAGAQIITVHGRTREMKGQVTGLADWDQIKAVKAAVSVPVFANGNIRYAEDVAACMAYTGCDGVMSAEGNLSNPGLFIPPEHPHAVPSALALANRYLDIVAALKTPTAGSAVKAHMFRLLRTILDQHEDLRMRVAQTGNNDPVMRVEQYRETLAAIAERLGEVPPSMGPAPPLEDGMRKLPLWAAGPYVRPDRLPVSTEVAVDENGEPVDSVAPSRADSPAPRPRTNEVEPCSGEGCASTSASRCPARSCLVHCRVHGAVAEGMERAAAEAEAACGGLVGKGCEAHEAKVAARVKRRKEKNAVRADSKRARRQQKRRASRSPEPDASAEAAGAAAEAPAAAPA